MYERDNPVKDIKLDEFESKIEEEEEKTTVEDDAGNDDDENEFNALFSK